MNKAKRGELKLYLPIGFAYDAVGRVVLDPDEQVRRSVQLVFATFQRTGSAFAVVREFRRQGWLFPRHQRSGPDHAWSAVALSALAWSAAAWSAVALSALAWSAAAWSAVALSALAWSAAAWSAVALSAAALSVPG